jgi:hypothetical protein
MALSQNHANTGKHRETRTDIHASNGIRTQLLIYKVAIKPIWTYGNQLWGTASTSNIEIMERFQSKALITDTPWYVPNVVIRNDLQIPTLK